MAEIEENDSSRQQNDRTRITDDRMTEMQIEGQKYQR